MQTKDALLKSPDRVVLVGNKCCGKTFLSGRLRAFAIESADVLLWAATGQSVTEVTATWGEEIRRMRSTLTYGELRGRIVKFIGQKSPEAIGELQRDILAAAPAPTILVGARYLATVRVFREAGFPILYIEAERNGQVERLSTLMSVTTDVASTILDEEAERCQLAECRNIADAQFFNAYDERSAVIGSRAIAGIIGAEEVLG